MLHEDVTGTANRSSLKYFGDCCQASMQANSLFSLIFKNARNVIYLLIQTKEISEKLCNGRYTDGNI